MFSADSSQLSSELNLIEVSLRKDKINSLLAEMSRHDYGIVEIHPDYTFEDARRLAPVPLPEWNGRSMVTPLCNLLVEKTQRSQNHRDKRLAISHT